MTRLFLNLALLASTLTRPSTEPACSFQSHYPIKVPLNSTFYRFDRRTTSPLLLYRSPRLPTISCFHHTMHIRTDHKWRTGALERSGLLICRFIPFRLLFRQQLSHDRRIICCCVPGCAASSGGVSTQLVRMQVFGAAFFVIWGACA